MKRKPPIARALPRWKKLAYGLLTTAIFFCLLEVTLTLSGIEPLLAQRDPFVGFAFEVRHFEERGDLGEAPMMRTARNKLAHLNDQRFAVRKPQGTFRIFCLGGSTTFGRPYSDATSFAGWLRTLLNTARPNQDWEVINAGGISYASYRVAALMEELIRYEPDLFIVYTGHNEFLEERTYRELRSVSSARRWLTLAAVRTRTGTLIHRLCAPSPAKGDRFELSEGVDTLLDRTVGPESYQRDDELRKRVVEHFELSLGRMVDLAQLANAEILFVRPACNLRSCSPFKSQPRDGLSDTQRAAWQTAFSRGLGLQRQGNHQEAIDAFNEARPIDDRSAQLHFAMGTSLFEEGKFDESEAAFMRAVDEDVCPLRVTSDLGAALDRIVSERAVMTIDFHQLLQHKTGNQVLGRESFLDHVHPTIGAHGFLARELVERLWEAEILPGDAEFSDEMYESVGRQVKSQIDPVDHARAEANLACVLHWAGKTSEAGPLALRALPYHHSDARLWLIAGLYLHQSKGPAEALAHLNRAKQLSPNDSRIDQAIEAVRKEGSRAAVEQTSD